MRTLYILLCLMLGMALHSEAQPTDAAYAQKLASLYKGSVAVMQPAELAKLLSGGQEPLILDTRTPREYAVSHIPTAVFVDYGKFSKATTKNWSRDRQVIVYCTVGYRSERIGEQLKALGFKHVHNLYGGIFEWVNQGHAVVTSDGKPTLQVHTYNEDWGQWLKRGQKVSQ